MLSPFGPAEQLGGGSRLISASSFCIRFALELGAFDMAAGCAVCR